MMGARGSLFKQRLHAAEGRGRYAGLVAVEVLDAAVTPVGYVQAGAGGVEVLAVRADELAVAGAVGTPLPQVRPRGREIFDAMVGVIERENLAAGVNREADVVAEAALTRAMLAPRPQEGTGGGEVLDTMKCVVGYVNVAVGRDVDVEQTPEGPRPGTPISPGAEEGTVGGEILDAAVGSAEDIHAAGGRRDGDARH